VFINFTVTSDLETRNLITLHAGSQLKVKHVTLDEVDPDAVASTTEDPEEEVEEREAPTVVSVDREPQGQLLLIKLSKDLVPGYFYRLGAEFSGHINNKTSEGLFKGITIKISVRTGFKKS